MTREELIAKLEAAEGPSRELDAEITKSINLAPIHEGEWMLVPSNMERDQMQVVPVPWFTSSLDAALTLAPDDCDYVKFISDPSGSGWELGDFKRGITEYQKRGEGITAGLWAIALCIAALRARGEG